MEFGDAATPAPRREEFPTLLEDFPVPVVKTYRPETVVAEKLHGMAKLGLANSRMKDYYDVCSASATSSTALRSPERSVARSSAFRGLAQELKLGGKPRKNAPSAPVWSNCHMRLESPF